MRGGFINSRVSAGGRPALLSAHDRLSNRSGFHNVVAAMTRADWMPLPVVISLLVLSILAFGLIAPNAMQGAMQPLPQIGDAAHAATGCIQMMVGAVASSLVAALYDGHSALSMSGLVALCSLLALVSYLLLARPAECVVVPS